MIGSIWYNTNIDKSCIILLEYPTEDYVEQTYDIFLCTGKIWRGIFLGHNWKRIS